MSRTPPPSIRKAAAAAAVTPVARELHLSVLNAFAARGAPPSRAQLERFPVENRKALSTAFAELVESDLVAVDDHGEIRAAYPFSARPTAILVQPIQGPAVHACCAIDALGMSAMLGQSVTIRASDPLTDARVRVLVTRDRATWDPVDAVVYAGSTGDDCRSSIERTCGSINFFTSPVNAREWARAHPEVTGQILERDDALSWGIAEFGSLMMAIDDSDGGRIAGK